MSETQPSSMWMQAWGMRHMPVDHFLGGRPFQVLRAERHDANGLDVESRIGPQKFAVPPQVESQAYNPSVVLLPDALRVHLGCWKCVYAASVRVDWMTQCEGFTQLLKHRKTHALKTRFGARKRTLLMLLDSQWHPLYWGWLRISRARSRKTRGRSSNSSHEQPGNTSIFSNTSAMHAAARWLFSPEQLNGGVSVIDARLFIFRGRLHLVGTHTEYGYASAVAPLHLELSVPTAASDGGPQRLQAMQQPAQLIPLLSPKCRGRSQAFFDINADDGLQGRGHTSTGRGHLYFMSWLNPGLVCELVNLRPWRRKFPPAIGFHRPRAAAAATVPQHVSSGLRTAEEQLVAAGACVAVRGQGRGVRKGGASACRLSLNGIMLRIPSLGGAFLGIGHLHRGFRDTLSGVSLGQNLTYFAHHYTHFFFQLEPTPPFAVTAMGPEFCLGAQPVSKAAAMGTLDCQIVQYITGMILRNEILTLAYGANDCSAHLFHLSLLDVLTDLRPSGNPSRNTTESS